MRGDRRASASSASSAERSKTLLKACSRLTALAKRKHRGSARAAREREQEGELANCRYGHYRRRGRAALLARCKRDLTARRCCYGALLDTHSRHAQADARETCVVGVLACFGRAAGAHSLLFFASFIA